MVRASPVTGLPESEQSDVNTREKDEHVLTDQKTFTWPLPTAALT